MRKLKRIFILILLSISTLTVNAKKQYDWTKLMNAIIQVESEGNPKAFNPKGNCAGILQITPILVQEVNKILKDKNSKKRYVYDKTGKTRSAKWDDRYSVEKSKEMFILLQEHFNPEHNIEKAIKCWNSGFYGNYKNRSTDYYRKVMKIYNGGK